MTARTRPLVWERRGNGTAGHTGAHPRRPGCGRYFTSMQHGSGGNGDARSLRLRMCVCPRGGDVCGLWLCASCRLGVMGHADAHSSSHADAHADAHVDMCRRFDICRCT
eukprot:1005188-Prymnesium_polylepis.2